MGLYNASSFKEFLVICLNNKFLIVFRSKAKVPTDIPEKPWGEVSPFFDHLNCSSPIKSYKNWDWTEILTLNKYSALEGFDLQQKHRDHISGPKGFVYCLWETPFWLPQKEWQEWVWKAELPSFFDFDPLVSFSKTLPRNIGQWKLRRSSGWGKQGFIKKNAWNYPLPSNSHQDP